jgi:hypothetical protein
MAPATAEDDKEDDDKEDKTPNATHDADKVGRLPKVQKVQVAHFCLDVAAD